MLRSRVLPLVRSACWTADCKAWIEARPWPSAGLWPPSVHSTGSRSSSSISSSSSSSLPGAEVAAAPSASAAPAPPVGGSAAAAAAASSGGGNSSSSSTTTTTTTTTTSSSSSSSPEAAASTVAGAAALQGDALPQAGSASGRPLPSPSSPSPPSPSSPSSSSSSAAAAAEPPRPSSAAPLAPSFGPRLAPSSHRGSGSQQSRVKQGVVHINSTLNNTLLVLTDLEGAVKACATGGTAGYKNAGKATPTAAEQAARDLARKAGALGFASVAVKLKGRGKNKQFAAAALAAGGLTVTSLQDVTSIPHNGCRLPRKRRL